MIIQKSTNGKLLYSYTPDYQKETALDVLNIYKIRHPGMFNRYSHEIFGNNKSYIRIDFNDLQHTTIEIMEVTC